MISRIKKYTALLGITGLVTLLTLYLVHRVSPGTPSNSGGAGAVLPKEDTEQIVVDPRRHSIVIHRPGGDIVTTLPDKPTTIDIRKDGTVKVTAPQFGLECRPFVGLAYSDDARISLGLDGLYWKRLYLGAGVQAKMNGSAGRVFVTVGYNVKDNLRIGVTYDHLGHFGGMLSVRI